MPYLSTRLKKKSVQRMRQSYYLVLFLFISVFQVSGQEFHWTMNDMSPLTINPANSGNFYGTARIGGIYRNQYSAVANTGFSTPSVYVDVPLTKGFRDQDWVGIGIALFQDKAGSLGLKNTGLYMSAAYHLSLNRQQTSVLSIGFQTGSFARSLDELDPSDLTIFGSELSTGQSSMDRTGLATMNAKSATEYAGGIHYKAQTGKRSKIRMGLRYGHIARMNVAVAGSRSELPARITGTIGMDFLVRPGLEISPSVVYERFSPASSLVAQTKATMQINPEKELDFSAGLGYRVGDAVQLLTGMRIGDLNVGIAFDITTSQLSKGSNFGGFELAASYIIRKYKEPEVDPVIFCPRF
jgi:type IX secretion system PorP/SprF family membrane protein